MFYDLFGELLLTLYEMNLGICTICMSWGMLLWQVIIFVTEIAIFDTGNAPGVTPRIEIPKESCTIGRPGLF